MGENSFLFHKSTVHSLQVFSSIRCNLEQILDIQKLEPANVGSCLPRFCQTLTGKDSVTKGEKTILYI